MYIVHIGVSVLSILLIGPIYNYIYVIYVVGRFTCGSFHNFQDTKMHMVLLLCYYGEFCIYRYYR